LNTARGELDYGMIWAVPSSRRRLGRFYQLVKVIEEGVLRRFGSASATS